MKLQLALDDLSLEQAIALEERVRDHIDIIEAGKPLTDESGNLVQASAEDGRDGADGVDGRDGRTASEVGAVVPQVRINPASRHWEISVDGGQTWSDTGSSADGKDGIDGQNGEDDIFLKVDESLDGQSITFTLRDGRTFTVPII